MTADVVVVGGGLAGSMAALSAARTRPAASVSLLPSPVGSRLDTPTRPGDSPLRASFAAASGLLDVLGAAPGRADPVSEPLAAVGDLPASHPYSVAGVEGVREALSVFDGVTGERYGGDGTDTNALLPTPWGRLRPTARYPAAVGAGLAGERAATTLVGFDELTAFDAPLAAERLAGDLPYLVNGLSVGFPADVGSGSGAVDTTALSCARAFDDAEGEDGPARADNAVVEGVAEALEVHLGTKDRAGFPAVLGLDGHGRVRDSLADRLGVRLFEVPLGPPSVPGLRLGALFADALSEAGVDVVPGTVGAVETTADRVEAIHVADDAVAGEQFVLATGGVAGGGLVGDRDGVRERVFDCHVGAPDDRGRWVDRHPLGDHAFARFGVEFDDGFRPTTARGTPEFENLRAAGRVLGGHDVVAESSVGGVQAVTGYVAGRAAGEETG